MKNVVVVKVCYKNFVRLAMMQVLWKLDVKAYKDFVLLQINILVQTNLGKHIVILTVGSCKASQGLQG